MHNYTDNDVKILKQFVNFKKTANPLLRWYLGGKHKYKLIHTHIFGCLRIVTKSANYFVMSIIPNLYHRSFHWADFLENFLLGTFISGPYLVYTSCAVEEGVWPSNIVGIIFHKDRRVTSDVRIVTVFFYFTSHGTSSASSPQHTLRDRQTELCDIRV